MADCQAPDPDSRACAPRTRRSRRSAATSRTTRFEFGFGDKIAPRLGASYDVFGDGRVKLYGSWGRYFDWVKYELSRGTFGGDYLARVLPLAGLRRMFSRPAAIRCDHRICLGRNHLEQTPGSFRDRRVPSFDLVAKDIKPMSQDNMNFGVEYQIAPQTVFRGNYVHNNLRRTIEDLGALDANGDEVYLYGNPGEGDATDSADQRRDQAVPDAQAGPQVRRHGVERHPPVLQGHVRQLQLRLQPAVRQLRRSRQFRRNHQPGHRQQLFAPRSSSAAASPVRAATPTAPGISTRCCSIRTATWTSRAAWRRTARMSSSSTATRSST